MKLVVEASYQEGNFFETLRHTRTVPAGIPNCCINWVAQGVLFEEGYDPDTTDWSWWVEDDEPSEHTRETVPAPEAS